MNLTDNFTLEEFTKSQTATRLGIVNKPTQQHIFAMRKLCTYVLEPLRAHFGRPVRLSSGYRSARLNAQIGGSQTSQHSKGEAADIEVDGVSNHEVAEYIRDHLPFDQLILEGAKRGVPKSGWVHVSYGPRMRRQVLTAKFKGGKATYYVGLLG